MNNMKAISKKTGKVLLDLVIGTQVNRLTGILCYRGSSPDHRNTRMVPVESVELVEIGETK